jgi:septal ring factor EnvC (AmiA/AmiB activator)
VRRNRSEALLARFHAACEKFFDRYAHRNDLELAQQLAAREQICADLEAALAAPEGAEPEPDDVLAKRVLALKRQWDQSPAVTRAQAEPLVDRFTKAMNAVIDARPAAFKGTDVDPEATRKRMEQLCQVVEGFAGEEKGEAQMSPAAILAAQLREALAANTIGGRADDEARWRNAADEVRKAQASWRRLGPVPDVVGRELEDRFHRACTRFFKQLDQHRRPSAPPRR